MATPYLDPAFQSDAFQSIDLAFQINADFTLGITKASTLTADKATNGRVFNA